jgi:hypothetical protein
MECDAVCFTVCKTELGVQHVSKPDATDDSPEASQSSGFMDWEEKDRDFQVRDATP